MGPPVGKPGSNRAAGLLSALDKLVDFVASLVQPGRHAWIDPATSTQDILPIVQGESYYEAGQEYERVDISFDNADTAVGGYHTLAAAVAAEPEGWRLMAGGGTGSAPTLRDIYDVPQPVRDAVSGGQFTGGELQGSQPGGSQPGQKFTTTTYGYEYQRGASGALVWCRYPKG